MTCQPALVLPNCNPLPRAHCAHGVRAHIDIIPAVTVNEAAFTGEPFGCDDIAGWAAEALSADIILSAAVRRLVAASSCVRAHVPGQEAPCAAIQ